MMLTEHGIPNEALGALIGAYLLLQAAVEQIAAEALQQEATLNLGLKLTHAAGESRGMMRGNPLTRMDAGK
jgi:hypothetical protein